MNYLKTFTGPAAYQITVQGKIDKPQLENLGSMNLSHSILTDKTISTLTGKVIDQAALSGILNTLFDNRFSVISVMRIE